MKLTFYLRAIGAKDPLFTLSPTSLFLQRNKILGLVRHEVNFKNALAGLSLKIDYETINSASEMV